MGGFHVLDNDRHAFEVAAGSVLFEVGERGDAMYAVLEGSVELVAGTRVLGTAGPGELVGELALLDDRPRLASAVAAVPSRLVKVDRQRFVALVRSHPTFALEVMRAMADRFEANANASRGEGST